MLLFIILLLIPQVYGNAVWTVDCSVLSVSRIDPIVGPGLYPFGHTHAIVGANAFAPNSTSDSIRQSTCSTCNVPDDLSNYWVPQLYIRRGSTFIALPMDFHVYYKLLKAGGEIGPNNPGKGSIVAFPSNFRMIAGSPTTTTPSPQKVNNVNEYYVSHMCYKKTGGTSLAAELPQDPTTCSYIRAQVTFPSCWDGNANVIYPDGGWMAGSCPSSHPKRIPTLFFEAIFDVSQIKTGDTLMYSHNDSIGYGFHGDFLNGWKSGVIQNAISTCDSAIGEPPTGCGIKKAAPGTCKWTEPTSETSTPKPTSICTCR